MTAFVLEVAGAVGGAEPRGSCALLGAGNCNDVELAVLLGRFARVHLVDLDGTAIAAARAGLDEGLQARVVLHAPVDLGGGLARLSAWRGKRVTAPELGRLPAFATAEALAAVPERFDVVVSCALVSQIVHTCDRVLGAGHAELEAIACALVVAHLRTLVQLIAPGGRGLVVTDVVSSETFPLDELWGSRAPLALLDELERSENHLSGTGPTFLRRILRTDDVVAKLVGAVRLLPPWLWHFNPRLTLLAYGLALERPV